MESALGLGLVTGLAATQANLLASVAGVKREEKGGKTKDGLVGHIHYIQTRFSFHKFSTTRNNIHTYLPPALFLRPLLPRPPLGGVGGSW